jgi:hypothetical protein
LEACSECLKKDDNIERDENKGHYRLALLSSVLDGGDEEQPKGGYKLPKPNYQAEKRRKDLRKKAKKEEKRLRKKQVNQASSLENSNAVVEPEKT